MSNTTDLSKLSKEELIALVNEAKNKTLSVKVAAKGGISVYGLGRFPVTLYASQWERLIKSIDMVTDFISSEPDGMTRKESA